MDNNHYLKQHDIKIISTQAETRHVRHEEKMNKKAKMDFTNNKIIK